MGEGIITRKGGSGGIKQTLMWDYADFLMGSPSKTRNVILPNVRPENSIIFYHPYANVDSYFRPDVSLLGLKIVDATTLTLERYEADTGGFIAAGGGLLLEFYAAKFKQAGEVVRNGYTSTTINFTQAINPAKTLVAASMTSRYNSATKSYEEINLIPTNLTLSSVEFMHSDNIDKLFYQILELR